MIGQVQGEMAAVAMCVGEDKQEESVWHFQEHLSRWFLLGGTERTCVPDWINKGESSTDGQFYPCHLNHMADNFTLC